MKTIIIFLLLSGCSHQVIWKHPGEPTGESKAVRTASKPARADLRRLVVAPVKYRYFRSAGDRNEELENQTAQALLSEAMKLARSRGYAVIPLYIYEDIIPQKFKLTQTGLGEYLYLLMEWAYNSFDGEEPTTEVREAAAKITRTLETDGVLVIQGSTTEPSHAAFWASLVLAGPFFPFALPFVQNQKELRADIYEAATGRIVWRGRGREATDIPRPSLAGILSHLEIAETAVATEADP
jgi:hypothetical protein